MREIAFLQIGKHPYYLEKMLESVRKHFALPIVMMTDLSTPECDVDKVVRKDFTGIAYSRIAHLAEYPHEELISLDTDLIVKGNMEHVFEKPFDIALTLRDSVNLADIRRGEKTPTKNGELYNTGVFFSRGTRFFEKALKWLETRDDRVKQWGGEQRSMNYVALNETEDFDILNLPCRLYNWSPGAGYSENPKAYVYHYKGGRKRFMK